ncbi:substrate-binding periplasmic protein [Hahella ganghwensis]|uniref:substrate-binding periplasmic protein n=1 Tax=Hahella ganghwensis TaxID=286420 RepID=UPI00037995EA|nr:transporter substrate-binding domain-containing protein [Hahella ganghwensis]
MAFRLIMLMILFSPLLAVAEDIEVTIYVDDAYKPFSYAEDGAAKGMYIDVLKTAFSEMPGFKVKIEPVPWNRGKQMMAQGKGFGLAPAFFHGHDWPYLYPYSLPFYTETIITVCTENVLALPRPRWPEDYRGLAVGNVAGFDGWVGEKFRSLVEEGEIKYYEAQGSEALIQMLLKERHDCIMMENLAFDYEFRRMKKSGVYNEKIHAKLLKGAVIGKDPVYIGYSEPAIQSNKYPFAYRFQKAFDVVIYQMIKASDIERIMEAYRE